MGLMQPSHRWNGSKWGDNIRYHFNLHIGEAEYTAIVDGGLVDPDRGGGPCLGRSQGQASVCKFGKGSDDATGTGNAGLDYHSARH